MSLMTTAPLALPERNLSMSYPADREYAPSSAPGPGPGAYYSRPPSSHGASSHGFSQPESQSSPDRNGSSHSQGFSKSLPSTTPQAPAYAPPHNYPATPISGPSYPAGSYYGISHSQSQDGHDDHDSNAPSPPHSGGRAAPPNFTPDGNPLVPVGISGGKMFQCRGYGQCDKVFTRSERPFPCHCGKSFSRLDNLRQHASTVHNDQVQLNSAMLDSLTPVHSALSARATREQRKRGEIVEVPKNAVERPRHGGLHRGSIEGSVTPTVVTAAAYPPYADDGSSGWDEVVNRPRASTGGAYDYHQQGVEVLSTSGVDTTPGPSSRRPGSSAGYQSGYASYYDGPSSARPQTGDASKPINPLGFGYRSMSTGGRDLSHAHYADSEPPTSAHGLPESPMYPPNPPVPQPNWSSPPPHSAYGHEHRTFYHPTPTPEGYSYPEPSHTPTTGRSYGPPPPGSAGSTYGYPSAPGAPPTPANPSYFGPAQQYPAPPHANNTSQPGYTVSAYGPSNPVSPFQFGPPAAPAPSSTPLTGSTSLPIVSTDYQYPPPSSTPTTSLKRRLDETPDDATASPANPSSAQQFNARKVPRSSLSVNTQPIRALQEHNPPQDDELWFPPATERRSSLAISALLGSPQADHKPRAPWDGSAAGNAGTGTGDMEEKAKALLGSAH